MHNVVIMPTDLSPLWISLKVAVLATVFTFFLGVAVAYGMLHYRGKGKSLLEGLLVTPLIFPPTVVGFLLLLLFGKNGPIGPLLAQVNLSVVFTWVGAVVAATVVSFPLMYRTALGAFAQVDRNLLAVARTLGASEWTVFRRIVMPLAWPGVVAGTMLAFARALGEFGATLMLAGNIPGQTQTIPMAIYFAVEAGAMNEAWFWAIAIMLISLSGIVLVEAWQRYRQHPRSAATPSHFPLATSLSSGAVNTSRAMPPQSLAPPLERTGLVVNIRKRLAQFDLDLELTAATSTLGILGGSGAGKSMLLRCIAGMETPSHGQITLNGRVLFDAKQGINVPSRDRRIGFLVQNYALFPHLTVAQNIAFGLPSALSKAEIKRRVEGHLAAVQLQGFGDRYPSELSGGQQQRVAFARALASEPELLLLDEPFAALDTHLRSQMEQEAMMRLHAFPGVSLLVTHNLEEVYRLCNDLLVLDQGRAVAYGTKHDIFERPGLLGVAQLTGCKNISAAVITSEQEILAVDWGIQLRVIEPLPSQLAFIGIRAHQIRFIDEAADTQENTVLCWLAATSETPHRMTLFLKFNALPLHSQDYHVQAEVFKEKWDSLKQSPLPWTVQLDPLRLILLQA
ncbi:MAG TPA: molybdate ABC transporter permease subunit [Stenomitos sp.]